MSKEKLPSSKPYLVRAIHEWLEDNAQTPYFAVRPSNPMTVVPNEYINDGVIILNMSSAATRNLYMENDVITASARFNGLPFSLVIAVGDVEAVFSRESGEGMTFDLFQHGSAELNVAPNKPVAGARPKLTIVK